jgi:hypothetical protein
VLFRVLPRGIVLVLGGFEVMTECDPSMMRGLFMISRFVMLGGLAMMFGGLVIVLRRLFVMLVNLVLCHSDLPDFPFQPASYQTCAQLRTNLLETMREDSIGKLLVEAAESSACSAADAGLKAMDHQQISSQREDVTE